MLQLYVRNIKKGFATNSSSYHSTLILTEDDYDKWTSGEILITDNYGDEISYDEFTETEYELDYTKYTSPSGDRLVIICKHGSDY